MNLRLYLECLRDHGEKMEYRLDSFQRFDFGGITQVCQSSDLAFCSLLAAEYANRHRVHKISTSDDIGIQRLAFQFLQQSMGVINIIVGFNIDQEIGRTLNLARLHLDHIADLINGRLNSFQGFKIAERSPHSADKGCVVWLFDQQLQRQFLRAWI